jgi:hypothetical protein
MGTAGNCTGLGMPGRETRIVTVPSGSDFEKLRFGPAERGAAGTALGLLVADWPGVVRGAGAFVG